MRHRLLAGAAVLSLFALTFSGVSAFGDERDDWVDKQQQAENERAELEEHIAGLDDELKELYRKLDEVRRDIPLAQSELAAAEAKYQSAQRELEQVTDRLNVAIEDKARIDEEIAKANEESTQSRQGISLMVREVYRSGDYSASPLVIAMTSKSTADISERTASAQTMAVAQSRALFTAQESLAVEKNRAARQEALTERISKLQEKAQAAEQAAASARMLSEQKLGELQTLEASETKRAGDVEKVKDKAKQQLAESERAFEVARANIARIDEENRKNEIAWQQNQAQNPGAVYPGGTVPTSGLFGYPLPQVYPVTSPFGYRFHPIYEQWRLHSGIDYGVPCGVPTLATANGVVTAVSYNQISGNYVTLNYGIVGGNSYQTMYLHLQGTAVSVGQTVSRGQVVGYVGTTGSSTGCHLHFELIRNGVEVDARNYM
ncbi:MAG: peptidoglycan DD-metalloendopeptidase family protein [Actinomycetaceae bacterium]|nr:peptidoglycan DD-metalloendopeptidase family protein [Actinomycetaceae bacterium]